MSPLSLGPDRRRRRRCELAYELGVDRRAPGSDEIERLLEHAHRSYLALNEGEVADYIPALAEMPPDLFGICLYGVSGRMYAVGDSAAQFTIQSVAKPFVFALVCEMVGADAIRSTLGVNSTGMALNSVVSIEIHPEHVANPMVIAGAVAATSMLPGYSLEKWDVLGTGRMVRTARTPGRVAPMPR